MSKEKTITASEALVEIEKGLRVFKAFERVHEIATFVAGLEQNQAELKRDIVASKKELGDLQDTLAATRDEMEVLVVNAKNEATRIVEAAKIKAQAIEAKAESEAQTVVDEAQARADQAAANADAATEAAATAEQRLADTNAQLAESEAKLEEVRAQINKLLGSLA